MNYSKSILLYQDKPAYGLILKLIIMIVPVALLAGSIYLLSSGDNTNAIVLLGESFFVGLIFWSVFPRSHQIYKNHLRIVLGGPFSVKVGFDNIKSIEDSSKSALSINFITKLTRNYISINKKKGWSITITPRDSDLFLEYANEALNQWVKTHPNAS